MKKQIISTIISILIIQTIVFGGIINKSTYGMENSMQFVNTGYRCKVLYNSREFYVENVNQLYSKGTNNLYMMCNMPDGKAVEFIYNIDKALFIPVNQ